MKYRFNSKKKLVVITLVVAFFVLYGSAVLSQHHADKNKEDRKQYLQELKISTENAVNEKNLLKYINDKRESLSLPELSIDSKLKKAAENIASEILISGSSEDSWEHAAKQGYIPSDGIQTYGIRQVSSRAFIDNIYGDGEVKKLITNPKVTDVAFGIKKEKGKANNYLIVIFIGYNSPITGESLPSSPQQPSQLNTNYPDITVDTTPYQAGEVPTFSYDDKAPSNDSPSVSAPAYTRSEASNIASNNCIQYSNSSAYQSCVQAYMRKLGY